jgi:hypothetical protein
MAIYQFLSEFGHQAVAAGGVVAGCYGLIKTATKLSQLDAVKDLLKLPGKLKFSKLEINLTLEK